MKKILIISSSFRINGNSETLANYFMKGASEVGHTVEKIRLKDLQLKYCTGCLTCQKTGRCILDDSINGLLDRIQTADILVFATPIYYYSVSGQLKTFLDRMNPLFSKDNKFKEIYLLASAADTTESALDGAIKTIEGFASCFADLKLAGVVYGIDASDIGDITKTKAIDKAYEMGRNIK